MIRRPPRSTLFPSPPLFRSRVSRKQPAMTEDTTMLAATRYRAAERLPPIVRAVLDARDEAAVRSEEHTSELQSQSNLVCRLLLGKKKNRERAKTQVRCHSHQ